VAEDDEPCTHTTNIGIGGATGISPAQCEEELGKGLADRSDLSEIEFSVPSEEAASSWISCSLSICSGRFLNRTVIVVSLRRLREMDELAQSSSPSSR
jgi:hypothetical protein